MTGPAQSDETERLLAVIGDAMSHAANEPLLLMRLEEFFSPRPARLANSEELAKAFNAQVDRVVSAYGGAPRVIIQFTDEPKPTYDTYMSAAITEVIAVFERARRSLCRAQAFMIGAQLLKSKPDLLQLPDDDKLRRVFLEGTDSIFWEHAESSFIRLAGYWDRVGQVLDFAFFSIRQYERDGFSAVVDRIRANALRMYPDIEATDSWRAIWNYKKSEREDGLQWLLSRRNLLVHSLHLRPLAESEDDELFESSFNHLDVRLRRDLAPGVPYVEIGRIHSHLSQAAALLPHVLALCETYAEHRSHRA